MELIAQRLESMLDKHDVGGSNPPELIKALDLYVHSLVFCFSFDHIVLGAVVPLCSFHVTLT